MWFPVISHHDLMVSIISCMSWQLFVNWIGYFWCPSVLQTAAGSLPLGLSAKGQGAIQFAQGNAGGDDQIRVSSMTVILDSSCLKSGKALVAGSCGNFYSISL